ncbi:unnamed protein product [Amoebophrya sp. A25]|nr:unnamed protein product [Amoebophrya sp. A25]|eukprot:GSA25T00021926001.1
MGGCAQSKPMAAAVPAAEKPAEAPPQLDASKEAPKEVAPAVAASTWYLVDHTFKEGCNPEDWWKNIQEMMADPEKLKAFHVGNTEKGFYNHSFNPFGQDHMMCVWECKAGTAEADFQKCLDDVVGQSMLVNKAMKIPAELCGGQFPYASAFAKDSAVKLDEGNASYPSSTAWFLVKHDMVEGKTEEWWSATQKMMADAAAMEAFTASGMEKGLKNHAFVPITQELIYCFWECKEAGMEAALQKFVDEDVGRGCFTNTLMEMPAAMTGGMSSYKSCF